MFKEFEKNKKTQLKNISKNPMKVKLIDLNKKK